MTSRWKGWAGRIALWAYALGVAGFYAVVARRSGVAGDAGAHAMPGADGQVGMDALPFVSIVVPARDEERNIRDCVLSLLRQEYPRFEVIVVDDGSTDATPDILRQLERDPAAQGRLRALRVAELPEGWAGKPHALHTGALAAQGEWLLFTDADTRHAPDALNHAVGIALARGLDLLSYGTMQDLPDFWGRVLMPMAYMGISMQYPVDRVNDPKSRLAIANGQYILIRRMTYDAIGGYARPELRATVLDDRDLAFAVKRHGGRMALVDGRRYVRTRMYRGLREHVDGWSKNAYVGSRGGALFYLAMIVGLPLACVVPFLLPLAGLAHRDKGEVAAGTVAVASILAYRDWLDRQMDIPRRYAWTHPLAALVFAGILARSLWWKVSGRGVRWRGRTIRV